MRSGSCVDIGLEAELAGSDDVGVLGSCGKGQDATPATSDTDRVSAGTLSISKRLSISWQKRSKYEVESATMHTGRISSRFETVRLYIDFVPKTEACFCILKTRCVVR